MAFSFALFGQKLQILLPGFLNFLIAQDLRFPVFRSAAELKYRIILRTEPFLMLV